MFTNHTKRVFACRAGYPIRHTFNEFVDRYRFLISGCPPAHKLQDNCRAATAKICQSVLGKADYQLGRTKVFLKDAQDLFLELERDRVLTRKILVLQVRQACFFNIFEKTQGSTKVKEISAKNSMKW